MSRASRALLSLLLAAASAPAAVAFEGNVNLFAGQKWFADSDWEPIEEQPALGVLFAFGQLRAPIHFAIDVFKSSEEATFDTPGVGTTRVEGGTVECSIGVRKVFRRQSIAHPHLGAGATLISADLEIEDPAAGRTDVDDSAFGFWIDGGITWRLASHLNLGIEVRYSRAELELGDIFLEEKVAGGGFHAGALIGFGW
jgi:opacity protein-like surface antigen